MTQYQLCWAVFVAVLVPLFLRQPADPMWITTAQISLCFAMVARADHRVRHG